jgi:hypothetical protein
MFEDFRKQSDEGSLFNEQGNDNLDSGIIVSQPQSNFLGMTAPQRFVIAVMLFLMTCILGTFFLLVTERIVPPFIY